MVNLGFCNRTMEEMMINEVPLTGSLTFNGLGLIICAVFGLLSVILSTYLMFMHATHYLKPQEQKHIIRILFMVPIYSVVSFLSYLFYQHTVYYEVMRDCYEAFAIASFFALMCAYIAPDLHGQKEYFRTIHPRDWVFPLKLGRWKIFKNPPRSGLTWFNIIWFCIFQYCFIRVAMTCVAVLTQALDRYCIDSLSPAFGHVWVTVIDAAAVSVAMYCVIQFYIQVKNDVAENGPGLKVLSIKGVIFFSFWQTLIIDYAVSSGRLPPTSHISLPDIRVGLPSMLLCIEMFLFSILHLWAYPWRVYDVHRSTVVASESAGGFERHSDDSYHGGRFGYKAFLEAYNPWDIIKAVGRGFKWMAVGRRYREQDISYKNQPGTALEDQSGLKQSSAYQKLSDSREHSPSRLSYHQPTAYGGRTQAYGVTHPSHSRPGTSDGTGDVADVAYAAGDVHRSAPYSDVPPLPPMKFDQSAMPDTEYHGATGSVKPPVPMPDEHNFR